MPPEPIRDHNAPTPEQDRPEALLLTAKQAAKVLAISERTLWQLTKDGELPAVRLGRAVRYDPRELLALIDRRKTQAK